MQSNKDSSFWLGELKASWADSGVTVLVLLEMDTNCVVGEQVVTTPYGEVGGVS